MSNGFVRHKKVQWVFNTLYDLNQFKPKEEGVYALNNETGDIYIWNSYQWILYYQNAIKVPVREPKVQGYFSKYNIPPSITGSELLYHTVELTNGNYFFNKEIHNNNLITLVAEFGVLGNLIKYPNYDTSSLSFETASLSGSVIYALPSLSLF